MCSLRSPEAKNQAWTPEWMVQRINNQKMERAILDLKTFARKDREVEIDEMTIRELNSLNETQALWYIRHLKTVP